MNSNTDFLKSSWTNQDFTICQAKKNMIKNDSTFGNQIQDMEMNDFKKRKLI